MGEDQAGEPLIIEMWKENQGAFDEDEKLKQTLFPATRQVKRSYVSRMFFKCAHSTLSVPNTLCFLEGEASKLKKNVSYLKFSHKEFNETL